MIRQSLAATACVISLLAFEARADAVRFDYPGIDLGALKPRAPVFSADGKWLLFTAGKEPQIYESRLTDAGWSKPAPAAFSNEGRNWEPFIAADGTTVLFVSSRTPGDTNRGRAFAVKRTATGWTRPDPLFKLDDPAGIWFPNGDPAGTVYFSGELKDQAGKSDLYGIGLRRPNAVPQRMAELSTTGIEWDPYVSPDGQWLVFASDRAGSHGRTDLWLSHRQPDGSWGAPVNAGPKVNSEAYEVAAIFSPDGKTLYFVREPDQVFAIPVRKILP